MRLFKQMKKIPKPVFRWIKITVAIYCLIGIAFYYLQEKILFHPVALSQTSVFQFNQPFKEFNIEVDTSAHFNIIAFTVPDSLKKGVVLYFHGNKENVNHYAKFAKNFTKNGYEVWMPDYPGFGKSTGALTEAILYEEALQVYKRARVEYPSSNIIIYGKSIGTGVAAQLASIRDCKQLILETPYYSIASMINHYTWILPLNRLLKFKLPTNEYLSKVIAPITIFHGSNDGLIPLSNALKLQSSLKKSDEIVVIEKGTHHNLNEFPLMQLKLDSLLKR